MKIISTVILLIILPFTVLSQKAPYLQSINTQWLSQPKTQPVVESAERNLQEMTQKTMMHHTAKQELSISIKAIKKNESKLADEGNNLLKIEAKSLIEEEKMKSLLENRQTIAKNNVSEIRKTETQIRKIEEKLEKLKSKKEKSTLVIQNLKSALEFDKIKQEKLIEDYL